MGTVALWAPEIHPPDDWLIPAVLYQERIATISPPVDLVGPDGRQAVRLAETLGDVWQPLRFLSGGEFDLRELVEELLPRWIRIAENTHERRQEPFTSLWLERARSEQRLRPDSLRAQLSNASERLDQLADVSDSGESQRLGERRNSDSAPTHRAQAATPG